MKASSVALVAVVCILLLVASADAQASDGRRSLVPEGKEWLVKRGGGGWAGSSGGGGAQAARFIYRL